MATDSRALKEEGHLSPSDCISQSIDVARDLLAAMNDERLGLTGTDPAALAPVFNLKADLAQRLSDLDQQRPADADTHPRWADYCLLLEQCREANAVNGRLVQDRQRHVRRALALLRGQPESDPELYTQQGGQSARSGSVEFGSA